jgi:prepilin signal peptidase PulO-like enzyme (type II secretory pathway)
MSLATLGLLLLSLLAGWLINRVADQVTTGRTPRFNWSWRNWAVYALAFGIGVLCLQRFGAIGSTLPLMIYGWFFLTVAVVDLEHRLVLNRMLLAALPFVALLHFVPEQPTWSSAFLGGIIGFALFLLLALIAPGGIGMGDVKLAGLIGLAIGSPGVWSALLLGMVGGGLVALLMLIRNRFQRGQSMAYAPYLSLGAWIVLYSQMSLL